MGAPDTFSYRDDPSVPPFPDDRPIVIFDGKCVMCSAMAHFIMSHDRHSRMRLLAAQAPIGEALYQHFGLTTENYETNILLADGRAWLKSEASIRIFEMLGFPWSLMRVGRILPFRVRNWLYEFVARNRLRWFGSNQVCFLPDPSQADRFIQ